MPPDEVARRQQALPYCPRPRHEEAVQSWMLRVGMVYGLNAHKLLPHLSPALHGRSPKWIAERCPIDRILTPPYLNDLVDASRIAAKYLLVMHRAPVSWLLTDAICNVCISCIQDDLQTDEPPFLRIRWRHSWHTTCGLHGIQLVRAPMQLMAELCLPQQPAHELYRLLIRSNAIEATTNAMFEGHSQLPAIILAIERIETAITEAVAGIAPNEYDWGILSATEFLLIVADVTSWALTNFECAKDRPPAEALPGSVFISAGLYFTQARRLLPPFKGTLSIRTLSCTGEPGLRAAALWWAHALLCEQHPVGKPSNLGPTARQWCLLKRRPVAGLYWLHTRMANWPRRYVRNHWIPLDRIL